MLPLRTALLSNRDLWPSKVPFQETSSVADAPEGPIQPPAQLIGLPEKDPLALATVMLSVPTLAVQRDNRIRVAEGRFSGLELVSGGENEIVAENAQLIEPGAAPRK